MEATTSKAALSIDEACQYLSIGRAHLYRLMDQGQIGGSLHIGRRRLLLKAHLDKYLEARLEAEMDRVPVAAGQG